MSIGAVLALCCLPSGAVQREASAAEGPCFAPGAGDKERLKETKRKLKADPLSPALNYELAAGLIAKGRTSQALEPLRTAARRQPRSPDPHLCLAELYDRDDYRVPAILALSRFLTLESSTPRAAVAAQELLDLIVDVETDLSGKVVIGFDFGAPTYEGSFGGMRILLDMAVASVMASLDPDQVALNEVHPELTQRALSWISGDGTRATDDFSRMVAVIDRFFSLFPSEAPSRTASFVESEYLPFFASLRKRGFTAPFVHQVFSPVRLGGAAEWEQENGDALERYAAWFGAGAQEEAKAEPDGGGQPKRQQLTLEDIGLSAAPEVPGEDLPWVPFQELAAILIESDLLYEQHSLDALEDSSPAALSEMLWPGSPAATTHPWIERVEGEIRLSEVRCSEATQEGLVAAEAAFNERNWKKARKAYERLLESDPECYVLWSHIGDTLKFGGDRAAALPYYDKAMDLNPYDYRTYLYKGSTLLGLGRPDEVRELIRHSLALRPRAWSVVSLLENAGDRLDLELVPPFEPRGVAVRHGETIRAYFDFELPHWMGWALCKAAWLGEPELRSRRAGEDAPPGTTSTEERECLLALLETYLNLREAPDETFEADPALERLFEIAEADFLQEFYFYEIASRRSLDILLLLPDEIRDRIPEYVRRFVAVDTTDDEGSPEAE